MMKKFISSSSAETKKFAETFAKRLLNHESRIVNRMRTHALVVALTGDLGSGKTTFVQGFFRGLGIRKRVTSPTFILMRRSALHGRVSRAAGFKSVYHVDAYRIKNPKELLHIGLKEILENPENIVLVEWAEKIKKALTMERVTIKARYGKEESRRQFYFSLPPTMITK